MSDEKKAELRDEQRVKESIEHASSEILGVMAVKGKVIESGAFSVPCSSYDSDEKVHRMHHPWSIYDVSGEALKGVMDRLRKELPVKGWKIVKDGPDKSPAKVPQIVANSPDGHMSADLRLWIEPSESERSSMIEVTVVSDCFRSKPGTAVGNG
ncbi:hypothetical protein [Streptomyces sp. NK08204]|uniref:hypothetical protein n=1 Tax=Streptomyces sp. NK08204 TaxID=2873260 RepID=UPI001CECDEFA|nr:hypothetical protein [Streptomyces sp. NK08204]